MTSSSTSRTGSEASSPRSRSCWAWRWNSRLAGASPPTRTMGASMPAARARTASTARSRCSRDTSSASSTRSSRARSSRAMSPGAGARYPSTTLTTPGSRPISAAAAATLARRAGSPVSRPSTSTRISGPLRASWRSRSEVRTDSASGRSPLWLASRPNTWEPYPNPAASTTVQAATTSQRRRWTSRARKANTQGPPGPAATRSAQHSRPDPDRAGRPQIRQVPGSSRPGGGY